jgi:hypothetical protein
MHGTSPKEHSRDTYFVIVKKITGEGYAKGCEGFLTVAGTSYCNVPTTWAHGDARQYNIGGRMNLRLFTVEKILQRICFPAAHLQQGQVDNPKPYDEYVIKDLSIEIHTDVGRPLQILTKKISDIIQEATRQ